MIVANRYTTSNAVHQASKLPETERQEFLSWLFDLEYRRLGLPKPDLVIYLDMPTELTERMMRRRGGVHRHAGGYSRTGRGIPSSVPGQRPPGGPPVRLGPWWAARRDLPKIGEDIHQEVWRRTPAAAGVPVRLKHAKWDVPRPICPLSAAVGTAAVVSRSRSCLRSRSCSRSHSRSCCRSCCRPRNRRSSSKSG